MPPVPLDPRTPVLVGVGQVTNRPEGAVALSERPGPVDLRAGALQAAAEDAGAAGPGGTAGPGGRLLGAVQSLTVVAQLGGRLVNPALAVAERLGIAPAELALTTVGGNMPQSVLSQGAARIARGDLDVVAVAGAEALYTSGLARRSGTALNWAHQDSDSTPDPVRFGDERAPLNEAETDRGLLLPIQIYPLFENALRAENGWSIDEHRRRIGSLWSRFSGVAAANPYAWLRHAASPSEIMEPGPKNRMVSWPYTKLCCANLGVDQGAGFLLCSAEAARSAGLNRDRWIFPLAAADAHDHWFVSERPSLAGSPAIRLAGAAALGAAGIGIDDVALIDLYSCFPSAVQIAARELGLAPDDPDRPLTLTGGLTFSGGPGNNYTSHAIATLVGALRDAPGSIGLATGLGWFATKHAVGLYSTEPPGGAGFTWRDLQSEVDAQPRCALEEDARGPVVFETYTVLYDATVARRAVAACRTPTGARTWAETAEPGTLSVLAEQECIGKAAVVGADRVLHLE